MSGSNKHMHVDEIIHEAVRRIVEGFCPQRVILFGSQARGDATVRSDIDLLVLIDDDKDVWDQMAGMYRVMSGVGMQVDIVVMPAAYFERFKPYIGTVARPADREGKVLYQRAA